MSLITQFEQIIQFDGPDTEISALPDLGKIRRIGRVSPSGKGYVSVDFYPIFSRFPPFTILEAGGFYFVSSIETGYQIGSSMEADPDAVEIIFADTFFD